jgi:nitroreductase
MDLVSAIQNRHSVRRYKNRSVPQGIVQQVIAAGRNAVPLRSEIGVRWYVAWNGQVIAQCLSGLSGVYNMFTSAPHYIIAVSQERPGFMENLGFCMEQLILTATALRLGTCWIGGMFSEKELHEFVPDLDKDERIVAITPLGYADTSQGARMARQLHRWGTDHLGNRRALHETVSHDIWDVPWTFHDETLTQLFELTRLAPSWANTQPWHFVVDDQRLIALVNHVPQRGNIREGKPYYRLDGGIAMCHFYLGAQAVGWPGSWEIPEPTEREQLRVRYRIPDEYDILGLYPLSER